MTNPINNKTFYITTPIYYINDIPHIGHAYSTIAADVLARYYRSKKYEVLFSTGTDENSKKTIEAAQQAKQEVSEYTDAMAETWQDTWRSLDLSFDDFVRTTEERHQLATNSLLEAIYQNNPDHIYKGTYEGKYCFRCEAFYRDDELVDGKCPIHKKEVELVKEDNWFFRLSDYEDKLLQWITDTDAIAPESRKNEVVAFIKRGLEDISISRANQDIGLPLPFDKSQKIYVWIEALINYLTVAGYPNQDYERWWQNVHHIVGKDIIKFHCIIWPAMLMSAGLTPPKQVFAHGFFTINGEKISKSLGNTIDPVLLAEQYGNDALRYFLLREIPFGADGDFSFERFQIVYETELGNVLGNLVSRVAAMLGKYNDGKYLQEQVSFSQQAEIDDALSRFAFEKYIALVFDRLTELNVLLEQKRPWELVKTNNDQAVNVLSQVANELIGIAQVLHPLLPETAKKIQQTFHDGKVDTSVGILFPRIEE